LIVPTFVCAFAKKPTKQRTITNILLFICLYNLGKDKKVIDF
jgi:hypothetical protein